jgi:hypothetical protein
MSNDNNNKDFIDLRPKGEVAPGQGRPEDPFSEPSEPAGPPKRRRRFIWPLIGLIVAVFIGLQVAGGLFFTSGPIEPWHVDGQSFIAREISQITTELSINRINVAMHGGDDIRITFDSPTIGRYTRPRWDLAGGTLNIYSERNTFFNIFGINSSGTVNIYLPADIGQTLDILNLRASTGRINLNATGFLADELILRVTTGNIDITGNIATGNADITTTTGRINISGFHAANDLNATATTGNLTLTDVGVEGAISLRATTGRINADGIQTNASFTATTTTGNINLDNIGAMALTATATTGRINADNLEILGNANLTATTGNVTVTNSQIAANLETRTSTGNITLTNTDAANYITNSRTGRVNIN